MEKPDILYENLPLSKLYSIRTQKTAYFVKVNDTTDILTPSVL
jgi:hypothetical protein